MNRESAGKVREPESPRRMFAVVAAMLAMIAVPAGLTLHTVRVPALVDLAETNPSPHGYTVSLLLFLAPIAAMLFWLFPHEGVRVSKRAFYWTIGLLVPIGAGLDFFFAHLFFTFPNKAATLGWTAPALGGGVPVEEYVFYFSGFVVDLLFYIWLDEFWLAAYSRPVERRMDFKRLLRVHPWSIVVAVILIVGGILFRKLVAPGPGLPSYFLFLVVGAMAPSAALLPEALPVINWRAFSLTMFLMLLISLMWEATLGVPYGWWGFQHERMLGLFITAWCDLPIEEIFLWITVTYTTVIVYEIIRRWKMSGRTAKGAFLGSKLKS
ncbi:MAG TPA: hypothetical protein VL346_13260 [Acidobacteriaceae bacterium]|nr:hypothetical protein [Acidobacteriaceae bacterium]